MSVCKKQYMDIHRWDACICMYRDTYLCIHRNIGTCTGEDMCTYDDICLHTDDRDRDRDICMRTYRSLCLSMYRYIGICLTGYMHIFI